MFELEIFEILYIGITFFEGRKRSMNLAYCKCKMQKYISELKNKNYLNHLASGLTGPRRADGWVLLRSLTMNSHLGLGLRIPCRPGKYVTGNKVAKLYYDLADIWTSSLAPNLWPSSSKPTVFFMTFKPIETKRIVDG